VSAGSRFAAALTAVVALGAAVRIRILSAGLPYSTYVDEHFVVEASAHQVAHSTWNTGWSWYPSLLADLTSMTARLINLFDAGALTRGARVTDRSPYIEVLEPSSLILAGRLVVLACAIGTVLLVGLLGARLGGHLVGVLAALLAAVLPSLVQRSAIVITDTPATFFALVVIYCATRLAEDRDRPQRWAVLAGVGSGLAFTSKYTTVFVAVALLVALAARRDLTLRQQVVLAAKAALAAGVAALVTMPRLVLRTSEVRDAVNRTSEAYGRWNGGVRYVDEAFAPHELGSVVIVLAAIGLVLMVLSPRSRIPTLGYLAFAGVTAIGLAGSDFQPFRNLEPLIPFLCIAAATTVVAAARRIGSFLPSAPRAAPLLAGAAMGLLCANFLFSWVLPYGTYERQAGDTRTEAIDWLATRVEPGDEVVVAEEIGILPSELDRIAGEVTVAPQRRPVDTRGARFVVAGVLGEKPEAWIRDLRGQQRAASFGSVLTSCAGTWDTVADRDPRCPTRPAPDAWHGNDQTIVIYEAPAGK